MELTAEILEEFRDWSVLQTSSGEIQDFFDYLEEITLARNARAAKAYIAEMRGEVIEGGALPSALTIEELLNAPYNDPDVEAWLGDSAAKEQLVADSNVGMAKVVDIATKMNSVKGAPGDLYNGPEPA